MINKNVCVFASSSQKLAKEYYMAAEELGYLLGINGCNIVYGGSRLGLMYACASSVKQNGGKIIGIMPKKLNDFGVGNPEDCDEFIVTEGMRERKALMDQKSDVIIALAGGFGTLEEIAEMIVQKQLGYNNKPIIFLNTNGFYDFLISFFDNIIKENFAKENSKKLYYVAQTPQEAMEYLKEYKSADYGLAMKF